MIRMIFATFLLLWGMQVSAQELTLSKVVKLKVDLPIAISHVSETLVLAFKDSKLLHETLDPQKFVPAVDLSGHEHQFIRSLFEVDSRMKLPAWLKILSEEVASTYQIQNVKQKSIQEITIFSSYNKEETHGIAFVLEAQVIHKIEVFGQQLQFQNVINNIATRF
ncbi:MULTISPECIES: hypothetical protein [unclassified Pseudoalteromonas]|uniref:hypothetical protein n=1 Tax=unclassified Pseudoalteromonas TaxID=194690 RepID=UPI001F43B256|nr:MULTISPECIES: hypothetical protein [unclassified Pseudoalteromonas]MCF2829384.1 hypothetical protein [Pseudoalteromonas sp. OF5H-5]MCF2831352.1 hypothetical protein [Pseudoalteromonas sp. DL2-H6]MCF2927085.1 hypothetical protein [Pseudoalteromonas sp. DL2-H1]